MPNNTNEKPILCSVCSKPLGETWSTCFCYPIHGKWHDGCDPHKPKQEWWDKEPYMTHGPLSDWFHIDLIVAESRRRARLEMAREMKEKFLSIKESHKGEVTILALMQEKLDSIIQEEEIKL